MNIIELKNAGIRFKGRWIFKGVDLSIKEGEKIVLLGPSGGGKSVFLKLCLGLLSPTEGEVLRLGEKTPNKLHKMSGVLFQNDALFESLTIGENVSFAAEKNSPKDIREYFSSFGLDDLNLNDFPNKLSGGMKKRLALARALLSNPPILFIDEPTSGLDPLTSQTIINLLSKIKNNPSETIITITHSPQCAKKLGDRLLFIDKNEKTIRELTKDEVNEAAFEEIFKEKSSQQKIADKKTDTESFSLKDYLTGFFNFVGAVYLNFKEIFAMPNLFNFYKRFLGDIIGSLPFVLPVCLLIGFLLALQSGNSLQSLGFVGWVPYLMVKSSFGDIGFLVIGFLLCGRLATSFCAEVWKMNLGNELDAITVMGKSPQKIILLPVAWAYVIGFPIIFLIGELTMLLGGVVYAFLGLGGSQLTMTYYIFQIIDEMTALDFVSTIIKGAFCGLILSITPMTAAVETDNQLLIKKQTPIPSAVMLSMVFLVIFNLIYP